MTALLSAASGCNQAPDDDPREVATARANNVAPESTEHRTRAGAASFGSAVKYELQGTLGGPSQFLSREGCDEARRAITEAQAKSDNQRSEHGALLPSRPMLACVPI